MTVQATTPAESATTSFTYVVLPPVNLYDQINGNIVKTGAWTDYAGAGSYGGSYGRTATPGASATVWFNGSQIDWIAMEGITTGKADVYIDGVKLATVNLAASSPAYQQDVWSSPVLTPGLHSFKIVRSAGNVANEFITLDGVSIAGTIAAAPIRYQQTDTHIVYSGAWSPFVSRTPREAATAAPSATAPRPQSPSLAHAWT